MSSTVKDYNMIDDDYYMKEEFYSMTDECHNTLDKDDNMEDDWEEMSAGIGALCWLRQLTSVNDMFNLFTP
jgi:hypothetical protein